MHCGRDVVLTVQCTVDSRAGLLLHWLTHWCCTATRRRCNFVATPWLTLMTHVSEMSDLRCLTLNWCTRVSSGSCDTETWGNYHCSVPATSCDYNSRTVRLPQALSFNSVCFPPNWPAVTCYPCGKASMAPAKRPSLSICPRQSSRRVSSANVPPSLSASTMLD